MHFQFLKAIGICYLIVIMKIAFDLCKEFYFLDFEIWVLAYT